MKTGGRLYSYLNTGSTQQPSEESLQFREEQLQPPDNLDEDIVNQSPKDTNQRLQDYPSLSMTPAQETPKLVQDEPRPAESSSRPRRERRRPACLTDYVT